MVAPRIGLTWCALHTWGARPIPLAGLNATCHSEIPRMGLLEEGNTSTLKEGPTYTTSAEEESDARERPICECG